MGKSCGKFLQEILMGQGGGKKGYLRKVVIGGNLAFGIGWCRDNQSGYSSAKSCGNFLWEILVGQGGGEKCNLRKVLIGGNLAFGIQWWGANQSGYSSEKSCRKFLWDKEEWKMQLKKGSDWWKFSIWNRVMGSQPIRIQFGKILWENLAGNSCRKFLWDKEEGKKAI